MLGLKSEATRPPSPSRYSSLPSTSCSCSSIPSLHIDFVPSARRADFRQGQTVKAATASILYTAYFLIHTYNFLLQYSITPLHHAPHLPCAYCPLHTSCFILPTPLLTYLLSLHPFSIVAKFSAINERLQEAIGLCNL